MKREVMDQIVALLASECSELGEDLDALEAVVLQRTRQLGQEAVQAVLKKKRRAITEPAGRASADSGGGSSGIGTKQS